MVHFMLDKLLINQIIKNSGKFVSPEFAAKVDLKETRFRFTKNEYAFSESILKGLAL